MMKLLKILGVLVIAVVVLIGAAAVLVPMFVDPNDHKDRIATLVKEATGRDLNLKGDIGLSVFPWIAIDLGEVELSNPPGFDGPTFAQTDGAKIRVKLMPLLKKQVEMDTVELSGLEVNLIRRADGTTNFEDLAGGGKAADDRSDDSSGGGPGIEALAINGLNISDSRFSWTDEQAGQTYELNNLNAKTGAVTLGEPVDLNVDFDVKGGPPTVEGAVALAGTVNADLEAQRYTIEGLSLTTDMAGDAVGGGKVNATIVGAVLADLAKQTANVTGLKLDIKTDGAGVPGSTITLSLSGDVATDLAAQAAKVSGLSLNVDATGAAGEGSSVKASLSGDVAADMSQQSATVGGFALDVDAKGGTIPGAGIKANVSGDVAADLANQILTISGLAVNALNLSANGDIKVENYASDLKYTGTLAIDQFNPREVMKALELPPIETADAAALSSVSGNFGLAGSANSVNLSPLNLTLDQTKLTGRLGVANFARAALRFDLKVDGIDADRYLPPAGAPAEAGSPGAAAGEAAKIPVDTLRSLDIDGKATIGKLKIANLNLSQLLATVKAKDGVIRLSPLAAQLYDGSYAGNIGIDASGSTPRLTLNEVVKGVQAGPLLEALQGKEGKILGTADLTAKLTAIGADTDAMKQTADGTIRFDFRNGALRGFNLAETLRQAKAKIGGGTVAASGGPNQTDFSELGGTINLKDGVANNPDFAAKSPFFRVIGNGNANLVSEALDYRTTASVVATTKGQGGEELKELAGVDIPLKVGGTFSNPTYGLDIEGLAKSLAQSKAKELLDGKADKAVSKAKEEVTKKLTEKIGKEAAGKVVDDKVKDAVGGALKGLFN